MANELPALEETEEAVKAVASMCSLFYKQLIRDDVPVDVAKAMAVAFVIESVGGRSKQGEDRG